MKSLRPHLLWPSLALVLWFLVGDTSPAQVTVVNMIPKAQSGETNQDSEPNLAVNPSNPLHVAGSAFTPDPFGGPNAPIFVSEDGGKTWRLNSIVPSLNGQATGDITLRFSGSGDTLYAGILRRPGGLRLNILRTDNFVGATPMTVLVDRTGAGVDQPYVQAIKSATGADAGKDRVYVGNNDFGASGGKTATLDRSLDAATAAAPAGFAAFRIESRANSGQDGPPIRPAVHADGTVYGAFYGWRKFSAGLATADVVVVRDDTGGAGASAFQALTDADGLPGKRVVQGRSVPFVNGSQADFGQERFVASNLSIAVDPRDSKRVYVAWADGTNTSDYTIRVRASTDGGATWSAADLRAIPRATNPALAVNNDGKVGFLYQQIDGTGTAQRWKTRFETTTDDFTTHANTVLADVPATTPAPQFIPYIGDYVHVMAVGKTFYGIFSANNTPDKANFPSGVTYQRNADFAAKKLLAVDYKTEVAVSIDPFFFAVEEKEPAPRYVYLGCRGSHHLARDTGTGLYQWRHHRPWLVNLDYTGADKNYWYYREREYPDCRWAFARHANPCGGEYAVWYLPEGEANGAWAFYQDACRVRPVNADGAAAQSLRGASRP